MSNFVEKMSNIGLFLDGLADRVFNVEKRVSKLEGKNPYYMTMTERRKQPDQVQTQPRVNKINWQELYEAAHSDLETYKAVLEDVSAQLSTLRGEYATLKSQNESLNAQNDCLWKRVNNNQKILEDRVRWLERQNKELLSINKMMSNIYGPKSCKGVYDKW